MPVIVDSPDIYIKRWRKWWNRDGQWWKMTGCLDNGQDMMEVWVPWRGSSSKSSNKGPNDGKDTGADDDKEKGSNDGDDKDYKEGEDKGTNKGEIKDEGGEEGSKRKCSNNGKGSISDEYSHYLASHFLRALPLTKYDLQCKQMKAKWNQFKLIVQPFIEEDEDQTREPVPKKRKQLSFS